MPVAKRGLAPAIARDWENAFLNAIAEGLSARKAAERAQVHPLTPFKRRQSDPEFAAAWKTAAAVDPALMEEEIARRGFHGTKRPVFYKGVECGSVREYSDRLALAYLAAHDPRYRTNQPSGIATLSLSVNVQAAAVVRGLIETGQLAVGIADLASSLPPVVPESTDMAGMDSTGQQRDLIPAEEGGREGVPTPTPDPQPQTPQRLPVQPITKPVVQPPVVAVAPAPDPSPGFVARSVEPPPACAPKTGRGYGIQVASNDDMLMTGG
jgi:hypothetical protein